MDPRIAKTKRDIRQALIELLEDTPYEKVTIKTISEKAMVARPTLYAHYNSVKDILIDYFSDLYEKKLVGREDYKALDEKSLFKYFDWTYRNKDVINILYKNNLESIIYRLNKKYIYEQGYLTPNKLPKLDPKEKAYIRYIQLAGGIVYAQVLSLIEQNWEVDLTLASETVCNACKFVHEEVRNQSFFE